MRTYYHFAYTCPNCHEPHITGKPIEFIDEKHLRCTSCDAIFYSKVNLLTESFPNTVKYVIEKEGNNSKNYLSRLPLMWKIIPNDIEKSYIEWMRNDPKGIFFITWPWIDVRFSSLLSSEYLLNSPQKKVIILGNFSTNSEIDPFISSYSSYDSFRKIIYTEDTQNLIPLELRRESNNLKNEMIFEKEDIIEVKYRKFGGSETKNKLFHGTIRKCKNAIIKESTEFSENLIREISFPKSNGEREVKVINKNGIWNVSLEKQTRWTGNLNYKKIWLWEILFYSSKLKKCDSEIKSLFYYENNNEADFNKKLKLHFFSTESEISETLKKIALISPDILIIENIDEIISDSRYAGRMSKNILEFLRKSTISTILMFSTNPDIRHLYKLCENETIFGSIKIFFHTWDSPLLLNEMKFKNESRHPNPIASKMNQISQEKLRKTESEYISFDFYNKTLELIESCLETIPDELGKDAKRYFNRVFSTVLNLTGDYTKPEILSVMKSCNNFLTYDALLNNLSQETKQEVFLSLNNSLKEVFHIEFTTQRNYLREQVISIINNIFTKCNNCYVTTIVNRYEVKGAEQIFHKECSISESFLPFLTVCSWDKLKSIERIIPEGFKHFVVSTEYPSLSYNLHSSNVDKFFFVGNPKKLKKIKEIVDKRLLEMNAYPVFKLSDDIPAPYLLRDLLLKVKTPVNECIKDIYDLEIEDSEYTMPYYSVSSHSKVLDFLNESHAPYMLNSGDMAVFCIDTLNRGIFLPFDKEIMLKDGSFFREMVFAHDFPISSVRKELVNREIILNKLGFYLSFRYIFFQFMMKWGNNLQFQKGPFEWKGFNKLFQDSVLWITLLERAIEIFAENNNISFKNSQDKVANILANSGITARSPDYISSWWSNYDEVIVDSEIYKLYRIGHPFSPLDMKIISERINQISPSLLSDINIAYRSYAAALTIQNLRRNVLKGHKENDVKYSFIFSKLEKQIVQLINDAELFRVKAVEKVNISQETEALKVIFNYVDLFESL
ncbi:MAG TPA: hypothetical protein HA262_10670 [Methanosarcina sp.]|jgi:hypothetical protein|nr:hypothetical protein [Methanosarcina sp.]